MAADDPDMKMMSARERAICSSLCFCLALSVLSGVAMIYLSVIIYIPSQREILSGFNEVGLTGQSDVENISNQFEAICVRR